MKGRDLILPILALLVLIGGWIAVQSLRQDTTPSTDQSDNEATSTSTTPTPATARDSAARAKLNERWQRCAKAIAEPQPVGALSRSPACSQIASGALFQHTCRDAWRASPRDCTALTKACKQTYCPALGDSGSDVCQDTSASHDWSPLLNAILRFELGTPTHEAPSNAPLVTTLASACATPQ